MAAEMRRAVSASKVGCGELEVRVACGSDFLGALASVLAFTSVLALALGAGAPVWARDGPAIRPVARTASVTERIATTREPVDCNIRFPPATMSARGRGTANHGRPAAPLQV